MSHLQKTLLLLISPALVVSALAADDSLDPKAPPLGNYEVKMQSTFALQDDARRPFWPIGWVKPNAVPSQPTGPVTKPTVLSADDFAVTSVLLGNPSLAVINGRAYGEGEVVRMPKAAAEKGAAPKSKVRVQVARILDGRVVLQSADGQSLEVALRRGKLQDRKPEDELLNADE